MAIPVRQTRVITSIDYTTNVITSIPLKNPDGSDITFDSLPDAENEVSKWRQILVSRSGNVCTLESRYNTGGVIVNNNYNSSTGQVIGKVNTQEVYIPKLAAVATSGSYADLSNKPTLATVATSGSYNDLSDKPTLATVATSGSYTDLSNVPIWIGTKAQYDALATKDAGTTYYITDDFVECSLPYLHIFPTVSNGSITAISVDKTPQQFAEELYNNGCNGAKCLVDYNDGVDTVTRYYGFLKYFNYVAATNDTIVAPSVSLIEFEIYFNSTVYTIKSQYNSTSQEHGWVISAQS